MHGRLAMFAFVAAVGGEINGGKMVTEQYACDPAGVWLVVGPGISCSARGKNTSDTTSRSPRAMRVGHFTGARARAWYRLVPAEASLSLSSGKTWTTRPVTHRNPRLLYLISPA